MTDFSSVTACGECCLECPKHADGRCPGCIEADGRVPEWAESGACPIHVCAKKHNALFCGLCDVFPCDKMQSMMHWIPDAAGRMAALRDRYNTLKKQ